MDNPSVLSLPDQFSCEMSTIPGYQERLKAMIFQIHFHEKIVEITPVSYRWCLNCALFLFFKDLQAIKEAAIQLKSSSSLKKILEVTKQYSIYTCFTLCYS